MSEVKLKPCPFCGRKVNLEEERNISIPGWKINCEHEDWCYLCDVWYDEYDTAEDCIQAWNTRYTENPSKINENAPNSGGNNSGE